MISPSLFCCIYISSMHYTEQIELFSYTSLHYLNRCYIKVFPEYLNQCGDWTARWVAVTSVLHTGALCSCTFNILEPNGYFNFHQVVLTYFLLFYTTLIKISFTALCNIKGWDFITEGDCVYCAVRSEYLNVVQGVFFFNPLIWVGWGLIILSMHRLFVVKVKWSRYRPGVAHNGG